MFPNNANIKFQQLVFSSQIISNTTELQYENIFACALRTHTFLFAIKDYVSLLCDVIDVQQTRKYGKAKVTQGNPKRISGYILTECLQILIYPKLCVKHL